MYASICPSYPLLVVTLFSVFLRKRVSKPEFLVIFTFLFLDAVSIIHCLSSNLSYLLLPIYLIFNSQASNFSQSTNSYCPNYSCLIHIPSPIHYSPPIHPHTPVMAINLLYFVFPITPTNLRQCSKPGNSASPDNFKTPAICPI